MDRCSADPSGQYNAISTWEFYGASVGTFNRYYAMYAATDTSCGALMPLFQVTISGPFALHGASTCGATCQVRWAWGHCSWHDGHDLDGVGKTANQQHLGVSILHPLFIFILGIVIYYLTHIPLMTHRSSCPPPPSHEQNAQQLELFASSTSILTTDAGFLTLLNVSRQGKGGGRGLEET